MRIAKLFNKIKQVPKRYLAIVGVGLAIAIPVAVHAGFGPDRQTFDWNVNPGTCSLQTNNGDRCGAVNPVFNSFINTPSYGDERNFTLIAPAVDGQSPTAANYDETQLATPGQEYWVRTLVHNDANQNLNCNPAHRDPATNDCTQVDWNDPASVGIAHNTSVSLEIPSGVQNGVEVMTKVHSSNATPTVVWDSAILANADQAFVTAYVPGSAVLYNGAHQTGMALTGDMTAGNGLTIGFDQMDGNVPGCFNYSAYVYVKVKVTAPALSFKKQVRMKGEDSTKWRDTLTVNSGDHVQYLLTFQDNGSAPVNNIVLKDQLPTNITVDPGTVRWIDTNHPAPGAVVPDNYLFDQAGFGVGNYGVNGGGYVMFDATVHNDDQSVCSPKNMATAGSDNVPEQSGSATVVINNCKTTVQSLTCDMLDSTLVNDRTYKFTTTATPHNGAAIKSYTYNFHDKTPVAQTNQNPYTHTFPNTGTFQVTVVVNGTVNGADFSTPVSNACTKVITVGATPTKLINTGNGTSTIAGIFAATTVAGATLYSYVLRRRSNG